MLGGLVLVPIVSLLTKKHAPKNTSELFECYNTTVTVPASSSLHEN